MGLQTPRLIRFGFSFYYVYTLPSFMRAINCYIAAVLALRPDTLPGRTNVLTQCIQTLQTVYNTVVSGNPETVDTPGILGIPYPWPEYPNGEWAAAVSFETDDRSRSTFWNLALRPYGAADQYAAVGVVDSYPASETKVVPRPPTEQNTLALNAPELTKLENAHLSAPEERV